MVVIKNITPENPVIVWWSGGVTSAVTAWLCVQWFGVDCVRIVFMDTRNEDDDTYRFKRECENWYGKQIETITHEKYQNIKEVWYEFLSLNVATGAICSTILKRELREKFQAENKFSYQAFGYEIEDMDRAKALKLNHPDSRPIFPLLAEMLTKPDCIKKIQKAHDLFLTISPPRTYKLGYHNNNCFKTGCVQGGIGYWQKIKIEDPEKFDAMAFIEHDLTNIKGQPVTMLKDQSKGGDLVFLKPHPKYPHLKDISMMKGRPVKPLMDCNGFCGVNDLKRNPTEKEINYAKQ